MDSRKKGIALLIMLGSMSTALMGCSNEESTAKDIGRTIVQAGVTAKDTVQGLLQSQERCIKLVKNSILVDEYPEGKYGDVFQEFFDFPTWIYFESDIGDQVVEFTGYFKHEGENAKLLLQFIVDEVRGTFEFGVLEINGVAQDEVTSAIILGEALIQYAEEHNIEALTMVDSEPNNVESSDNSYLNDSDDSDLENSSGYYDFDDSILNDNENTGEDSYYDTETESSELAGYILPYSDSKYYTAEEISQLDTQQLRLARNEIFARYGYSFQDETLRDYFSSQPWYYETGFSSEQIEAGLNDYERANLSLIKQYEN